MRLPRIALAIVTAAMLFAPFYAKADDATDDAFAARDICVGVAAKFINANPGAVITFNAGKFKIEKGAEGRVTVFEDSVSIGQLPSFDYRSYTACIDSTMKVLDARRKRTELNKMLALFNAAYELNNVLYTGTCLQSTAMLGVYFGDMSQTNQFGSNMLSTEYFSKLLIATNTSLTARLQPYFGNRVRFALDQDVKFFRYVAGREVPYFDLGTIGQYNSYISSNVSDEYRPYVALGSNAGALSRLYALFAVLLQLDRVYEAQFDPISVQKKTALRASLQCIRGPYSQIASSMRSHIEDADLSLNVPVPQLERLFSISSQELNSDNTSVRFVSELRRQIKVTQ